MSLNRKGVARTGISGFPVWSREILGPRNTNSSEIKSTFGFTGSGGLTLPKCLGSEGRRGGGSG